MASQSAKGNGQEVLHSKSTFKQSTAASVGGSIDADARHGMVAQAAYYVAERRGFGAGAELDDWLTAERQMNNKMN
jgi:hypothetical protein